MEHSLLTRQNKYKSLKLGTIGNRLRLIMPKPSQPSNRRVHFTPGAGDSGTGGGKRRWKPDFVTTNMFHGKPEKLSKAEEAEVDAQMSSDPECRCRPLVSRLTHSLPVFHLLDRDRERVGELSAKDVPESE
jgi:hypothetical protein